MSKKAEQIYYKYIGLIRYICNSFRLKEQDTEDVIQDVFLKVMRCLDSIGEVESDDTKVKICIITKSVILDRLRKQNRTVPTELEEFEKLAAKQCELIEKVELRQTVQKILLLPDGLRDVLELSVYYGLSAEQISKMLGISSVAVRKRLERARKKLKEAEQ
ncbi:MAG: RNA polymerase sigma factor [Clostridia bacterium]|nr:RNA polymerase sigma factor [Clostridia bacterium]